MKLRRWVGPEAASLCEVTGEVDPIVAIERLARELIDVVGFDRPPFDPAILASFRGVREIRRATMAGAARILPKDGVLMIEVNEAHSLGKQNFSADHEVTHTHPDLPRSACRRCRDWNLCFRPRRGTPMRHRSRGALA